MSDTKGWTFRKEEADLWFEVTDEQIDRKHAEEMQEASKGYGPPLHRKWTVTVTGLRGTEFAPAPDGDEDGLDDILTMREAPEEGYVTELVGLASLDRRTMGGPVPETLPRRYYLRKGGRYGALAALWFEIGQATRNERKIKGQGWVGEKYLRWVINVSHAMIQARPLGSRVLIPWVE